MAQEKYCPGENTFVECDSQCPLEAICYTDITEGKVQCCKNPNTMCTSTKMATYFNDTGDFQFQHRWSSALDPELYYKDPITGAGCPLPYAYSLFLVDKVLPRDFDPSSTIPLTECKESEECLSDEFCGASVNWITDSGIDSSKEEEQPRKFCYKYPSLPDKVTITDSPSSNGLASCIGNTSCRTYELCYMKDGWKGKLRTDSGYERDGLCVKAAICQKEKGDTSLFGRRLKKGSCDNDADCLEIPYPIQEFRLSCIPVEKTPLKMCCITRRKQCKHGFQNLPPMNCSATSDCNLNTTSWTNWCDSERGECCSEQGVNWASPDGVTPLYNEPACEEAVDEDPASGKCPTDPNASCLKGHCHQSGEIVNGTFVLGEYNYLTNFPCLVGGKVPDEFTYSYCNPDTNTIIKLGSIEIANIDKEKSCQQDSDCTPHGYLRCIHIESDQGACSQKLVASTTTTSISSSARTTETSITMYIAFTSYSFYKYNT